MTSTYSPFIWAGGKTKMLSNLYPYFPKKIGNYYEPFCGGGAIFIHLLQQLKAGNLKVQKMYINDANHNLINAYECIQNKNLFGRLVRYMRRFESEFDLCKSEQDKEKVYYRYRDTYNDKLTLKKKGKAYQAALFLFINRTCYRGLYRESKTKNFNTPYGHKQNNKILDLVLLKELHSLFNTEGLVLEFSCLSFEIFLQRRYKKNDFIYMDPPYMTTFNQYQSVHFTVDMHKQLLEICKNLADKKISFMQSSSDKNELIKHYKKFCKIVKFDMHHKIGHIPAKEIIMFYFTELPSSSSSSSSSGSSGSS